MIIGDEIRNRMISARPLTFSKGNWNMKIREMLIVEEDHIQERVGRN